MCDFSLQSIKSRPAKIGDKLTTRGFSASEDASVAVCLRPGTELSFAGYILSDRTGGLVAQSDQLQDRNISANQQRKGLCSSRRAGIS